MKESNPLRSFRCRPIAIALSVLAAAGGLAHAAQKGGEWPRWRGANYDNVSAETGLLKEWPEGGPPLAWKAKGIGAGYGTVSVTGGRIYTTGDADGSGMVFALNEADGKPVWKAKIGKAGGPGGYDGPRGTPTVDGAHLYALGQFGDLVCLDTATGKEKWRKNLEKDFKGQMMSGWGYSESPLVDGDKLICTPGGEGGTLLALNKNTGQPVWRSKELTDSAAYGSVLPVEMGGQRQYVVYTNKSVAGVAADSGKMLWRADREGATAVIPTPVIHENHVFVTSGYGVGCNLFEVTPAGGKFTAEQVYDNKEMKNHLGGVVGIGEHIYGTDDPGILKCIELKTGEEVWKDRSVGKGSVTAADGHLYVRSEGGAGAVALIEATPDEYREKGRFDQPDRSDKNSWAQPVIAGGKLYLRDQDVLLCYDVKAK